MDSVGKAASRSLGLSVPVRRPPSNALAFRLFLVLVVFTLLSIPGRLEFLGVFRPTVTLVVLVGLLILMRRTSGEKDPSRTTLLLNVLVGYVVVTLPFIQWPGSVLRFGLENFVKAIVFFYFCVQLVDDTQRLRLFIYVVLGCQIFRVLEPLTLHLTTGYWGSAAYMADGRFMDRLSGAPSDIINPNGLAFVVLTAIPFMHYLLGGSPSRSARLLYLLLLVPLLYALLLTGSRSGMVGLVVVGGFILLNSKRKALMAMCVGIAALAMISTMDADQRDRYLSIFDRQTQNAATATGRLEGVTRDLDVAMTRPIFGHGIGTSREALANIAGVDQYSHNLYTETFIEIGVVGLSIYLAVLISIVGNVRAVSAALRVAKASNGSSKTSRRAMELSFCQRCGVATLGWVIMCATFSLASYGLSEFYWYMTAGISVALKRIVDMSFLGETLPPALNRTRKGEEV